MKDVTKMTETSRNLLVDVLDGYAAGKVRVSTARDLFRAFLADVAGARGESLGTLAAEAADDGA